MAIYVAACLSLGFIFRKRGADTEDYLLAGRSMAWWVTGVSYVASLLSNRHATGGKAGYLTGC